MFSDYAPFEFPGIGTVTLVAPFFGDIDISKGTGSIRYEVHTVRTSASLFSSLNTIINDQMDTEFSGAWLLLADWRNVPEFGRSQSYVSILFTNTSMSDEVSKLISPNFADL